MLDNSNEEGYKQPIERISNCAFCKGQHYIQVCPDFLRIPIEKRSKSIVSLKLCLNCLRSGHFNKSCRRPPCRKCHGKHNILLHIEKHNVPKLEANVENISYDKGSNALENLNITNNNSASCMVSDVLLSTARVDVKNKNGN